jgi:hypothetical protein
MTSYVTRTRDNSIELELATGPWTTPMDGLQARLQSFKKSEACKEPEQIFLEQDSQIAPPADFVATPETLAEAEFYYQLRRSRQLRETTFSVRLSGSP